MNPWKRREVIGDATLYLGDCLEILPTLPKVDAVITDPPYDKPILFDCPENSVSFFDPAHRPDGRIDEFLFWIKHPSTKNNAKKCSKFVEQIAVRRNGNVFHKLHWSQMTGCYNDRHISSKLFHPWEKPLSLIERLVRIYTDTEFLVADPFMGSGTTGVACANLGRAFIGIEIHEPYFEIACERIENAQRQGKLFDNSIQGGTE